jgi:hypothetical protein
MRKLLSLSVTRRTIVGQGRRLEFLPVLAMTAKTRRHGVFHFRPEFIPAFDRTVTDSAVDPGEGMTAMVEEHISIRGKSIDPSPWDLFFAIQIGLHTKNIRGVGFHDRMAAHAEHHARNRGLAVFLGARMAKDTFELLGHVLAMAEGDRLRRPARRAAPSHERNTGQDG